MMGGRSSSSSNTASNQSSSTTDNRLVIGNDSIGASSGGSVSLSDMRDQSMVINDSRDLSTSFQVNDSSTTSTSTSTSTSLSNVGNTTTNNVDPGALKAMERALLTVDNTTERAFSFGESAFGFAGDTAETFTRASIEQQENVLDYLSKSDATRDAGFAKLLDVGTSLFTANAKGLERAQTLTAEAYRSATAEKSGALDNRTILLLGLAAAGVFGLMAWRK